MIWNQIQQHTDAPKVKKKKIIADPRIHPDFFVSIQRPRSVSNRSLPLYGGSGEGLVQDIF